MRRYLERTYGRTLASRAVLCPHNADSTLEEARALRPCLEARGWRNIIVVTSNTTPVAHGTSGIRSSGMRPRRCASPCAASPTGTSSHETGGTTDVRPRPSWEKSRSSSGRISSSEQAEGEHMSPQSPAVLLIGDSLNFGGTEGQFVELALGLRRGRFGTCASAAFARRPAACLAGGGGDAGLELWPGIVQVSAFRGLRC